MCSMLTLLITSGVANACFCETSLVTPHYVDIYVVACAHGVI